MSINFSPGPKIQNLLDQDQWWRISNYNGMTTALTGTGLTERSAAHLTASSGTTASSTALARTTEKLKLSKGKTFKVIDWSKRIVIFFPLVSSVGTTNGISRFTLGKDTSNGIGALDDKGVGIQIDNLALKGIVHDGSSGATVDFSLTMTDEQVYLMKIVSDGAGNIEWSVDGVSKGTSNGGPTGDGTNGNSVIQLEADNGGDSAGQTVRIGSLAIYVEQ